MEILIFGFSFRKGSYSKIIAETCKELAPKDVDVILYDIRDIPLFNQDFENNLPKEVISFKEAIRKSDGIIIITPEYNYSIPGYLKNAIDFASRPYNDNVFYNKPIGIISESIGMLGGSRAQYHLRQVLIFLEARDMKRPELFIPFIHEKIKDNKIVDEQTLNKIKDYLESFVNFCKKE